MFKLFAYGFFFVLFCFCAFSSFSQNVLKGKVIDSAENKKIYNSIVALIDLSDTTLYRSWRSGPGGDFSISKIPSGKYTLLISYPRMADFLQNLDITDTSIIDLGDINMISEAKLMQEVVVTAGRAMRMRGDTLEYTADSFAVKPGANVQALLKRLPGIEVSRSGAITAQGQEIKKLLVDGDEFFTDDPKFAAQYLRANAVDKVQVFDKKSDEAVLTGFDDGKKTKTINLKLKNSAKNGYFGKVATGANGDGNYEHELMGAAFKGFTKAGIFGIASKSMSRDFSSDVLSKVGGSEGPEYVDDGAGVMVLNKSQSESIGSYSGNGLPALRNAGAHFSNKWDAGKSNMAGNYKLRSHRGEGWNSITQFTQVNDTVSFLNKKNQVDNSKGFGQNLSGQLGLQLDTFTLMMVRLSGSLGKKDVYRANNSSSVNFRNIMVNNSTTDENESTDDRSFKSSVNIMRSMPRLSSNLNVTFEQDYSGTTTDNYLKTGNNFFDAKTGVLDSMQLLDRLQASTDYYQSYGGRVQFTSNLSKAWLTQVEYGIKTRISESRFNTLNVMNGKYDQKIDSLSNNYDFNALTQIAGAGVNYRDRKFSFGVGAKAFLTGFKQVNKDIDDTRSRTFTNFAPYIRTTFSTSPFSALMLNYSGSTLQPSIDQLQPLKRSLDQLNIQEGNPDLRPGFNNNLSLTIRQFNLKKELMLMGMLSGTLVSNSIIASTTIDDQNKRVSKYVNVDGLPSLASSINIMKGWRPKGLNIGFGLTYNHSGSYNILNGQQFKMLNNTYGFSTDLHYHLKELLEVNLASNFNFTNGRSELATAINSNNFSHRHSLVVMGCLPWKVYVQSDITGSFNPGNSYFSNNVNVITWNASIQKKFFANESLAVKAAVNDILNKNTGYSRTIDGANWTESNGFVLRRYFMFSLIWNFMGSF